MNRLKGLPTLRIDPSESRSFIYRGRVFKGFRGDTVATALFGNGIRIFSRSIKYHRPRGLYSLDGESGNCLMDVDGIPNVRASLTLLKEGMIVKPQNTVGPPEWDLMGFMDRLDWAMPAGFYYRYFHKPYRLWPFFHDQIRKAAGIGRIDPSDVLRGRFEERYLNAAVCIIGGGAAGMQAALAAADQGLRVVLVESRPWLGGLFEYRTARFSESIPLYQRARDLGNEVEENPGIRLLTHTHVVGFYSNNHLTAVQVGGETDPFDEQYIEIRARYVVVATGCTERPLIFENNDRPGVMQTGCAHRLARTYGLLAGERAVFSVADDLGLESAVDLADMGLEVACVADSRTTGHNTELITELAKRRIPFMPGWVASDARGKTVKGVTLTTTDGKRRLRVKGDLLAASAGWTPAGGLLNLAGVKMSLDPKTGGVLPATLPDGVLAAGRLLGFRHPLSIEASGRLAGLSAAGGCGADVEHLLERTRETLAGLPGPEGGAPLVRAPGKGRKGFVCYDEDVTVKHIQQACDMGFDRAELAKRFTAAGTGPSQAGIPGYNLPVVLEQCRKEGGKTDPPTTVRPPLRPTLLATYAGPHSDMYKRTPLHDVQEKAGAVFRRIGVWKRARYFSADLNPQEEVEAVRNRVGIIDVSTLGKFRIFGPDALKALQRVYVGDLSKLREGRVKYAAMCNDDGCVVDDGIVVKRSADEYYFTTSTARAGATLEWIRYHTRYEDWDFQMVNLTDALGAVNVAGPEARSVLRKLTDEDIGNESFPFGAYRELVLGDGIPARVMRLGFVGEISYEIHVDASIAETLWHLIMEAGRDNGIRIFGVEAQNVLRLEKGHVIIGQESEIRTTLHDLNLGFLWSREKSEKKTVGAAALRLTAHQPGRLKLVGFQMDPGARTPKDGSIVVDHDIRGHVCTARYSYALQRAVGMALVEDRLAREGNRLAIFEDDAGRRRLYAEVVSTPFYDPEGKRMKG